jgi:hypothetical protein
MSITDEIRAAGKVYAGVYTDMEHVDYDKPTLDRLCDRIDAEHDEALSKISRAAQLLDDAEKERDCNYANWQECKQKVLQGNITFDELNAKIECLEDELAHCIELPKDADNVPWHVGDRDEDGNVVTQLRLSSDGWYAVTDGPSAFHPEQRRHHHAPTVEDVLTEFGIDWEHESDCEDRAALLKEYAAKLRLAEGEDA